MGLPVSGLAEFGAVTNSNGNVDGAEFVRILMDGKVNG